MQQQKLHPDSIYAALYSRPDGQTYHWALILAESAERGAKFHVSNLQGPWKYVVELFDVGERYTPLVVLVEMEASTRHEALSMEKMNDVVRDIPLTTPKQDQPHPFTCRIWFREALRTLHRANVLGTNGREFSVDDYETYLISLANKDNVSVGLGAPWKAYATITKQHLWRTDDSSA